MIGQRLAKKIRAGERVYGTCTVTPSTRMVGAIAPVNPDFVFIDTEHNVLDRTQVSWMCHTYAAKGIVPIVRLTKPDAHLAASTLDDGALGIVAPYIETMQQVDDLRGAVKHRPLKGGRLRDRLDGQSVNGTIDNYIKERNANNVLILNIESQPAIDALDEIVPRGVAERGGQDQCETEDRHCRTTSWPRMPASRPGMTAEHFHCQARTGNPGR